MDILKTAIDWTKAEALSSAIFIAFGAAFLAASFGFWQLGKTEFARAYIVPMLIAGGLLMIIGVGLFFPSLSRIAGFETAYGNDASAFVALEIERADKVLNQYAIAVYKVIPLIIVVSAVLFLFLEAAIWRASLITTIAMMAAILLVDTNANARLELYRQQLALAEEKG